MAAPRYITLCASLPALGPILAARTPPINRARLTARLRGGLSEQDLSQLQGMARVISWEGAARNSLDDAAVAEARRVIADVESPTLAAYLGARMELRTAIAALRRRAAGQGPPGPSARWGHGRYLRRMRARWGEPDFGVGRAFPWIVAADRALSAGDAARMERIVLDAAWRQAERFAAPRRFDFEAVALYVARWALLERWTRYDAVAARARFAALLAAAAAPTVPPDPAKTEAA